MTAASGNQMTVDVSGVGVCLSSKLPMRRIAARFLPSRQPLRPVSSTDLSMSF